MKNFGTFLILLPLIFAVNALNAQGGDDCIDPDLINPDILCLDIWAPVCGCDGVTYSNDCYATAVGGVTSYTQGECAQVIECNDLAGLDFGMCDMVLGVGLINGTCTYMSGCGWIIDEVDYSPYFFDEMETCQMQCEDQTVSCLDLAAIDFGPCDMYLGVGLIDGTCIHMSGCGWIVNDVDYSPHFFQEMDECQMECEESMATCFDMVGLDFGICDLVLGAALIEGTCTYISGCGYMIGDVDYSPYFFEEIEDCVTACEGSEPVCLDLAGIDFGDCEAELGIAVVSGACVSVSGCDYNVDGADYSNNFFGTIAECEAECEHLLCVNSSLIDESFDCWNSTEFDDVVCGCDGVTYANSCFAEKRGGVVEYSEGPCACPDESLIDQQMFDDCITIMVEVCGCDSVTYADPCTAMFLYGISEFETLPCDDVSITEKGAKDLKIYPNPATTVLTIELEKSGLNRFRVFDISGRVIFDQTFSGTQFVLSELSAWPAGWYVVEVSDENSFPLRKSFIKK